MHVLHEDPKFRPTWVEYSARDAETTWLLREVCFVVLCMCVIRNACLHLICTIANHSHKNTCCMHTQALYRKLKKCEWRRDGYLLDQLGLGDLKKRGLDE